MPNAITTLHIVNPKTQDGASHKPENRKGRWRSWSPSYKLRPTRMISPFLIYLQLLTPTEPHTGFTHAHHSTTQDTNPLTAQHDTRSHTHTHTPQASLAGDAARSDAGHADAAAVDDGRRRGAGLGVEDVVEHDEERGEEGEGGAGGEDAPAQHGAGERRVGVVAAHVLGVVCVPHRARQQAHLRDHERQPAACAIQNVQISFQSKEQPTRSKVQKDGQCFVEQPNQQNLW